jgi:RNA polymerase sigma factor (sigma-70 family)
MSEPLPDPSTELIDRWRDGDQLAANVLFQRYVDRLSGIVTSQLSSRFKSRMDADDVLQSGCRSFFRRVQEGQFRFDEDDDVWKLLVTITLNKLRNQIRRHSAAKRNAGQEFRPATSDVPDDFYLQKLSGTPEPVEAFAFSESIEIVADKLSPQHALLLVQRMEGHSQQEIAESFGTSDRSIRRMLDDVKELFQREMSAQD